MKVDWRRERDLLLVALMFFTRIPMPRWVPFDEARLNGASRYFPLVGLLVGAVAALVYGVAVNLWSPALALVLATAATVLLTGAFHEDGFADVCDGFGGGWDREQVLSIMKDSRIGTYGTVGLGLLRFTPNLGRCQPCRLRTWSSWKRLKMMYRAGDRFSSRSIRKYA